MQSKTAWQRAWLSFWVILLVPIVILMFAVSVISDPTNTARDGVSMLFGVLSVAWLAGTLPMAIWIRSYVFRAGWQGEPVDPESYLRGLVTIWTASGFGALLASIGCLVSHTLMPCVLPLGLALMIMCLITPRREAMAELG